MLSIILNKCFPYCYKMLVSWLIVITLMMMMISHIFFPKWFSSQYSIDHNGPLTVFESMVAGKERKVMKKNTSSMLGGYAVVMSTSSPHSCYACFAGYPLCELKIVRQIMSYKFTVLPHLSWKLESITTNHVNNCVIYKWITWYRCFGFEFQLVMDICVR